MFFDDWQMPRDCERHVHRKMLYMTEVNVDRVYLLEVRLSKRRRIY